MPRIFGSQQQSVRITVGFSSSLRAGRHSERTTPRESLKYACATCARLPGDNHRTTNRIKYTLVQRAHYAPLGYRKRARRNRKIKKIKKDGRMHVSCSSTGNYTGFLPNHAECRVFRASLESKQKKRICITLRDTPNCLQPNNNIKIRLTFRQPRP